METPEAGRPLRLTLLLVGVNAFGGLSYGYNTGTLHNIVRWLINLGVFLSQELSQQLNSR